MFESIKTFTAPFHAAFQALQPSTSITPLEAMDRYALATVNTGAKFVERVTGANPITQAWLAKRAVPTASLLLGTSYVAQAAMGVSDFPHAVTSPGVALVSGVAFMACAAVGFVLGAAPKAPKSIEVNGLRAGFAMASIAAVPTFLATDYDLATKLFGCLMLADFTLPAYLANVQNLPAQPRQGGTRKV